MNKYDIPQRGELYCDTRFGGVERWYYEKPEDAEMRIPTDIVRCVCFICVKARGKYETTDYFIGTGFFVHIYRNDAIYTYLVTAKHVLEDAKSEGYKEFHVRLNKHGDGSEIVSLPNTWVYHENPAIDVAVLPFNPLEEFNVYPLSWQVFVSEERSEWQTGIGDELLVTGLFSHRWGYQRNIPIVRSGIIAAMPEEPLIAESGEMYNAYLAEVRSINGLSGSPVFVVKERRSSLFSRVMPKDTQRLVEFIEKRIHREPAVSLLGMIRGHWDLKRQDEDSLPRMIESGEIDRLNAGIAVVTPSWDIVATIDREVLMK